MANSANRVISSHNYSELTREVMSTLSAIPHASMTAFDEAGKKTGKSAVAKLKATAPRRNQNRAGQWKATKEDNGKWVIHCPKYYRLPHLLIRPHIVKSHGIDTGKKTGAHDYITPVEKEAIEEFEQNFVEAMNTKLGEL